MWRLLTGPPTRPSLNAVPAPPSLLHWKVGGLFTRAPALLCGSALRLMRRRQTAHWGLTLPPLSLLLPSFQNRFEKDRRPSQPRPYTPVMLSWWVRFNLFAFRTFMLLLCISWNGFFSSFLPAFLKKTLFCCSLNFSPCLSKFASNQQSCVCFHACGCHSQSERCLFFLQIPQISAVFVVN